jgi:hypothetical protein
MNVDRYKRTEVFDGQKKKRRKGGRENLGAGFIVEIIPVSTV